MNNFTRNYEKILETLQIVESKMNFLNQIRKPRLSDIELIAIDLTFEFMDIDSERDSIICFDVFRIDLYIFLNQSIKAYFVFLRFVLFF